MPAWFTAVDEIQVATVHRSSVKIFDRLHVPRDHKLDSQEAHWRLLPKSMDRTSRNKVLSNRYEHVLLLPENLCMSGGFFLTCTASKRGSGTVVEPVEPRV